MGEGTVRNLRLGQLCTSLKRIVTIVCVFNRKRGRVHEDRQGVSHVGVPNPTQLGQIMANLGDVVDIATIVINLKVLALAELDAARVLEPRG
jgi:hypothetical protein